MNTSGATNTTLAAPLGHINVHIRDGSAILLHSQPGYTIRDTLSSPYSLLVSQTAGGYAFGTAYFDDGESIPPTPSTTAKFSVSNGLLIIRPTGSYNISQRLTTVTILGARKPAVVKLNGNIVRTWQYRNATQELVITAIEVDLNIPGMLSWL